MRWKKLVKLAMDHPYFDDRRHTLSEAQAEAVLSSGYMSFGEFMEGVKRRMDEIDIGVREPINISTILPNESSPHNALYSARMNYRLLRNIAIAGIAVMLLTGFLAFTSPGRAIAQAVYRVIISVVDGKLLGKQDVEDSEFGKIDLESLPAEFASVEEVKKWIPLSVAHIESEKYMSQGIAVLSADETNVTIRTKYKNKEGVEIVLTQHFYAPGTSWGNSTTANEQGITQLNLPDGLMAYTGKTDDNIVFAVIYTTNGDVMITSTNLSVNGLVDVLEGICLE